MPSLTGIVNKDYNFCTPLEQTKEGLRYNIPLYLRSLSMSLRNYIQTGSSKLEASIESFMYYLNGAFKRAEELNLAGQTDFAEFGRMYYDFLEEHRNRLRPFAKELSSEGRQISDKYAPQLAK